MSFTCTCDTTYMSIFSFLGANFGQKRVQVFDLYLEKCVDAKFLRLVEKNVKNCGEMRRR